MLLNVHSYYSLRYGTLSPNQLIEGMLAWGYDTAVLTDINNSTGSLDFIHRCRDKGLNGLAGMEFRNQDKLLYIGVARNNEGFREMNALMTTANQTGRPLPDQAPAFNHVFVVYPFGKKAVASLGENEYIGIRIAELTKIALEPKANRERYVILQPLSFLPGQYKLHTQLRAIANNLLISQLKPGHVAKEDEVPISKADLLHAYKDFPQLIHNTSKLIGQCRFDFDFREIKNKKTFTSNAYDDKQLLHQYTMEGFVRRYGKTNAAALERVKRELEVIDSLKFCSYFLITDDICRHARSKNYYYVGRGSGANSVVAYCLGITDVDPIELDLYFERFLNPKRQSLPDFDIDFCWNERDDMYSYIFHRYQPGHTALMGTMSTFRSRSILREMGKVYGLPKGEIDRLVNEPDHMLNKNEVTHMILSVYNQLADFPNQRSIHASGILISELPLTHYSALDLPPKSLPTVQYDMHIAEDIGFEKLDILSQRGIGHIRDCKKIVFENQGKHIRTDHPRRFFNDPKIAAQLKRANTIGCFYIESPAMRQLLAKLNCDNYLTLVAASSIIRPGVSSSGMMKAYIERHHDPSRIVYPHPVFKEQLKETFGVMVYQEDVIKIGHHYGGLDLADADVLRRMMSGKGRDSQQLKAIETKFFDHCKQMGYPETASREIWRQMESFAGFSFNKAHSASYAVESYQSLYLKTYFPLEFMVAVLNNYGGFYSGGPSNRKVYISEARKAGGNVCLPCVNKSEYFTSIDGSDIYLGFDCLLHLQSDLAQLIPKERKRNGNYTSLENFVFRTGAGLEQLIVLIRVGALRFTGIGKKELLLEAHLHLSVRKKRANTVSLFGDTLVKPVLPELETSAVEDLYDEIELIGYCVSRPLFDLAKSPYRGDVMTKDLAQHAGKVVRMVGDFVVEKHVPTKNSQPMKFGSFLDANGDLFDTVHFSSSLARYPLRGTGVYLLEGRVLLDFGYPSLEVTRCGKMPLKADPRSE